MAKVSGVGTPRVLKGVKYFPIYYRHNKVKVINTMIKADTGRDAYFILQERIAEYFKKPKALPTQETDYDVIREALRKDISSDTDNKKTIGRYMNIFNYVFVDFRQQHYLTLSGCGNLPVGFFRTWKSNFKGDLRSALIVLKAIMTRLTELGYANENDLKQVRAIPTPEGLPKLMPKHTDKQIYDLLEYIKNDRPDFYKPIKFMRLTGRRVAETCAITKDDITMEGFNPIVIQTRPETTKIKRQLPPPIFIYDKEHNVVVDKELDALVRSGLANNKTPWLFSHRKEKKIDPNYLWKYLAKVSIKVIGVYITPHFFDKKFLTVSQRDGINKDAMAMANRRNVSVMIKHYVETTPEGQAKVLEKNRQRAYNEKA